MNMIEKCARAVQDVKGGLNYDYADFCRDAAIAVLRTLREPTPEMVEAGAHEVAPAIMIASDDSSTGGAIESMKDGQRDDAARTFAAMIDAALSGDSEG